MCSLHSLLRFSYFLIFFTLLSSNPTLQTTLISPVSKDKHTNLFTLSVYLKTPLRPTKLFLDLSFLFPWTVCNASTYNSSSYRYIDCGTDFCETLGFGGHACGNCIDTSLPDKNCIPVDNHMVCGSFPENPVTRDSYANDVLIDTLALPKADVSTQTQLFSLSNYTFSCAPSSIVKGLPKGVTGLASLGRSKLSIQAQITAAFSTPNSLAICFPGSSKNTGVAFFGSRGPYYAFSHSQKIDIAKFLLYTPLIENPVSLGDTEINYETPSNQYFIGLTSIRVNGKQVPINSSLLTINKENGFGGTKISSDVPYGVLESSIYKAFTKLFVKEASSSRFNLTTISTIVKPFSVCYSAERVMVANGGPLVPTVDLVLHRDDVVWKIGGSNSMVRVTDKKKKLDVWCLGFVDGGVNNKTSIVIGGKQLEENFVQFDLESNRFGFSSSLASRSLSCADFKKEEMCYFVHSFGYEQLETFENV
ncbi:hypothetical protein AAHE18_12G192300 [Arachis hypogaea]